MASCIRWAVRSCSRASVGRRWQLSRCESLACLTIGRERTSITMAPTPRSISTRERQNEPPNATEPPTSFYAPPSTLSYAAFMAQCEATYPVNAQQIDQVCQEAVARNPTQAEVQEVVANICPQQVEQEIHPDIQPGRGNESQVGRLSVAEISADTGISPTQPACSAHHLQWRLGPPPDRPAAASVRVPVLFELDLLVRELLEHLLHKSFLPGDLDT